MPLSAEKVKETEKEAESSATDSDVHAANTQSHVVDSKTLRGTDNVTRLCGSLTLASTPGRLRLESEGLLKFLTLGLMGNTQASSDPLRAGRWFCRERSTSLSRVRLLSIPAKEI